MTDLLAQIKADREAGTPGPWVYRPHEYTDWGEVYFGGFRICQARDPKAMGDELLSLHRQAKTDPWEANARRIARLPDLEAAYIREREAADELAEEAELLADAIDYHLCDGGQESIDIRRALAAYRAATEGKG